MVSTAQDLASLMVTEDYTNGVWNYFISDCFKLPDYLVIPEYQNKKGRADLAVVQLSTSRLILIYEGKKFGGGFLTGMDAEKQAKKSLAGQGSTPLIVFSLGPDFAMYNVDGRMLTGFDGYNSNKQHATITDKSVDQIKNALKLCRDKHGSGFF